jgi:hypothetical protein
MADFVFNVAKGKIKYYAELPAANDALIVVLLKTAETDATLKDYTTLSALLAAGGGTANVESNATNYVRKTASGITVTVDNTNDRLDIDMNDITWTGLGGATNNTTAKLLVCYDDDTTGGTDANLVPLTAHDFVVTTDGSDVTAQIAAAGFARAA